MFVQVAEFPEELKQLQHGIHFDIKAPDYVWFNHCIINEDSNLDHPGMIQQDVYHSFDVNSIPIKAIAKGMVGIALIETKDIPYLRSLGEIIIIKKHLEWFSKSQHECVLYALTQKIGSDVKFGSVQPLGDLTDRLSPDDIVVDAEDKRAAMELKTIARPISGSTRAFEAHAKYKKAVELRRGLKKWDLIIFVQTLGATYHNFGRRIDDQVLQYYYKWFLIGIALGRKLRAASGPVENKLEFDQFRASLKHVLLNSSSSHDYTTMDLHRNNPNNDLQISEEEWIHWSKKPVNFESVFDKLLHKAQKDYLKPTVSEPELLTTFESAWKKFVNNWESFGSNTTLPGTRPKEEQKPICIWPMIYPLVEPDTSEFSHEFSNIELGAFVAGKGGLYEAWSLASDYAFNHPESFIEPKDLATMTPKEHRIHRNKYMRVDLRYLSESSLEELALQGLWAKKRRNQDLMKLRKQLNKRPVHPDCITKDVDDFIRNNLKMTELSSDITLEPFRKSYNAAKEHLTTMPDITTKIEDFISYFSMTSIGQNSALIGLISEELNLSLNQFCKKGHCVLKKIPFYDLYLLIRPTTATGKMFFSIAAKKENFSISELPFREASTITENYIIYDFVRLIGKR